MKNYEHDPKYWTQFDEDINNLPIDKIVISSNKNDTARIKTLLWNAVDCERLKCGIAFDWYSVYQFLCENANVRLITKETNSIDEIFNIIHNTEEIDNLCIIECKNGCLPAEEDFDKLSCLYEKYGTIYATVNNSNIKHSYRINFLFK